MNLHRHGIALAALLALTTAPGIARAFDTCPANSVADGYTCDEQTGSGKSGGYFRVTFPSNWDGDLIIANHGFDLNDKHIRPHGTCLSDPSKQTTCASDSDCPQGDTCNEISYMGLDQILLPMGKAIAAGTYHESGWAVFGAPKDIKDIIDYVKKSSGHGGDLKRVIITGFSGGGAVTGQATLTMKIDGAVPLCAAVGGGLPTWDVAMDIRMVYDFLCDGVGGAKFASKPDMGEPNTQNSGSDAQSMALKVDTCLGMLGVMPGDRTAQQQRLDEFLALTNFAGVKDYVPGGTFPPAYSSGINLASAMGFATLGLGDFVRDPERLGSKAVGLNDGLDYASMGTDATLAGQLNAGIKRLTKGAGRSKLAKASWPDFVKGKGAKVGYPILLMSGANDWLVIPEFGHVYTKALDLGGKDYLQTWTDPFGHCVFTAEETTAIFHKYFDWLGPVGGPLGTKPTLQDVEDECVAEGGVVGDSCNFNHSFTPNWIADRIPVRPDWPEAAKATN